MQPQPMVTIIQLRAGFCIVYASSKTKTVLCIWERISLKIAWPFLLGIHPVVPKDISC